MRLEKAKVIIKENYKDAMYGIFDTRNIIGDRMEIIYCDNELQIEICRDWGYFEVFGLTDEEFEELIVFYYELGEKNMEE